MTPGPPPKDHRERRRRNAPAGGEWTDLAPLERPVLPPLPRRARGEGPWSARTRALWSAWRQDPATGQWTSADAAFALDTAYLAEEHCRTCKPALAAELRLRMDGLGLTAKGKRALRWRIAEPAEVVELEAARRRAEGARTPASRRRRRLSAHERKREEKE